MKNDIVYCVCEPEIMNNTWVEAKRHTESYWAHTGENTTIVVVVVAVIIINNIIINNNNNNNNNNNIIIIINNNNAPNALAKWNQVRMALTNKIGYPTTDYGEGGESK